MEIIPTLRVRDRLNDFYDLKKAEPLRIGRRRLELTAKVGLINVIAA